MSASWIVQKMLSDTKRSSLTGMTFCDSMILYLTYKQRKDTTLRQIIGAYNVDMPVEAHGVRSFLLPQKVPQQDQGAIALLPQILRNGKVDAALQQ